MHLKHIEIKNFRNIEFTNLDLKERTNIFFGLNGQGKTNFLEAVFILFNKRSFRKTEGFLVNLKEDLCYVRGILDINNVYNDITFYIKNDKKTFLLNNKIYKKKLPIFTFFLSGDVLFYFKNFPFYRRKLINKMCYFLYGREFLNVYNMLIKSKKSLSKATETKDRQIIGNVFLKYKKIVDNYRVRFLEDIKDGFEDIKNDMALPNITIKILRDDRDDIVFLKDNKKYLSLGELKSVIFSIYLSTIKKKKDNNTIMFIDDFNSEWDNNKIEKAFSILSIEEIQSFIMMNQNLLKADYEIRKGEILSL